MANTGLLMDAAWNKVLSVTGCFVAVSITP